MKVIVGCEESQVICKAFRAKGHEAYSCDIIPCNGGHPEWHIQDDVLNHLGDGWDLGIFHPMCTHLAVSGARWFKEKEIVQNEAIVFFFECVNAPIPKICIKNPIGIMSTLYRKPDQYIQPYEYGHPETKKTCLWLKGLPKLVETNNVRDGMLLLPKKQQNRIHYMSPSDNRSSERSKTYTGWAEAMATQWNFKE